MYKLQDMRESFGSKWPLTVTFLGAGSGDIKGKAAELGAAAYNKASEAKTAALDWIAAMTSSTE